MADKSEGKSRIGIAARILLILLLVSFALSLIVGLFIGDSDSGNVALIRVAGPIVTADGGFFSGDFAVSGDVAELISRADKNPAIEAIIIEVNSPGGSAVASDEIGLAIKRTNKTTVAVIRDVGASGGYWVASAADHVIANRMSVTGSIGAIASYLEFSGLLDRYNISYERLVAGEYKDIGSPLKDLTPRERVMVQQYLDEVHQEFIKEVARNRGMAIDDVKLVANGMFFSGSKAMEYGLVDGLGTVEDAKDYIERKLNITAEIAEYRKEVRFSDLFSGIMSRQSFSIGKGIGSAMLSGSRGAGILS